MVKHAQNILITVSEFLEIAEAHPQSWKRPQIGPISVVVRQYSKNFLGLSPHTPLGGLTAPPNPQLFWTRYARGSLRSHSKPHHLNLLIDGPGTR